MVKNLSQPDIILIAIQYDWDYLEDQKNIKMISFTKTLYGKPARINIYYGTGTVSSSLTHPKTGKTQLFRRNVTKKELHKIFINPRWHSNKGYRKK